MGRSCGVEPPGRFGHLSGGSFTRHAIEAERPVDNRLNPGVKNTRVCHKLKTEFQILGADWGSFRKGKLSME